MKMPTTEHPSSRISSSPKISVASYALTACIYIIFVSIPARFLRVRSNTIWNSTLRFQICDWFWREGSPHHAQPVPTGTIKGIVVGGRSRCCWNGTEEALLSSPPCPSPPLSSPPLPFSYRQSICLYPEWQKGDRLSFVCEEIYLL